MILLALKNLSSNFARHFILFYVRNLLASWLAKKLFFRNYTFLVARQKNSLRDFSVREV